MLFLPAGDLPDPCFHLSSSLSESFFMVKGAALFLQQGNSPQGPRSLPHPHKHAGDLPQHLQVMINLLRCEDRIKLAVRLESAWTDRVRYMVVVYSSGRQDTEENILLGVDFSSPESKSCTIGMVLRLWSDTKMHLDGDGGFSVSTAGKMHIFKPVSVQAMWSALQILHKSCEVARRYNYFPGGMALVWATYYESCIASDQSCINEWNAMQDLESTRPDSPALYVDKPTERERAERLIKAQLRSIMMSKDLENVTSKRKPSLPAMSLTVVILPARSLEMEYLATWKEPRGSGKSTKHLKKRHQEIGITFSRLGFAYHNMHGSTGEETTDLLAHWNGVGPTTLSQQEAKKISAPKCLVHCKMGVNRIWHPTGNCRSAVDSQLHCESKAEVGCNHKPGPEESVTVQLQHGVLQRMLLGNFSSSVVPCKGIKHISLELPHDAIFGILNKVKPSYKSCASCMYSSASTSAESFGESCENLHPVPPCHSSTICTQPSFLSHETPEFLEQALQQSPPMEIRGAKTNALPSVLTESNSQDVDSMKPLPSWPFDTLEKAKDVSKAPAGDLLGQRNSLCDKNALFSEVLKEDSPPRKEVRPTKDLKYLLFSKDLEKPTSNSYLMQHQESLIQLQKAGLVRKHTKELERLKSLPSEAAAGQGRECPGNPSDMAIPEETPDLVAQQHQLPLREPPLAGTQDTQNVTEKLLKTFPVAGGVSQKTSTPIFGKADHMSSFTKDFLKTVCYTPSSSRSSNLTRSSSSDSIHSVRGKPGLVKQRTQEIETRLRLAGLTVSSPLKRSNSLAKLGSLNLSSEDLTSEMDTSALADLKEAKLSEASMLCNLQSAWKNTEVGTRLLVKSTVGKLKSTLWEGKS
uniref:Uncharacterized protein n=1 Tax=Sphaerodactylus townsendi TaxID=933632 RepID=A0ACB8FZB7_9SAUR